MILEFKIKVVYGKDFFYPMNQDAKVLCTLMKRKALQKDEILKCKEEGWQVNVKHEEYLI